MVFGRRKQEAEEQPAATEQSTTDALHAEVVSEQARVDGLRERLANIDSKLALFDGERSRLHRAIAEGDGAAANATLDELEIAHRHSERERVGVLALLSDSQAALDSKSEAHRKLAQAEADAANLARLQALDEETRILAADFFAKYMAVTAEFGALQAKLQELFAGGGSFANSAQSRMPRHS